MKWVEGKYEQRWRHGDNYYCWQDLLHVMFVTLVISVIVALMIALLFIGMNPRVASAGDITNFRTATRQAPATLHLDYAAASRSSPVVKVLFCEVSAYSPTVQECDSDPLTTASGKRVYVGGIAADWDVLPAGSIVIIPNYNNGNPCTVIDTGGAIQGNKLDVFMWSSHAAVHWGRRRNVKVQVLYVPKAKQ